MGWVFSAVFGYTVCPIPTGWLVDRLGTRLISSVSITLWSACAMLTGAATNLFNMIAVRLGLAVGETGAMPACNKFIRQWFPSSERAVATAIFHSRVFVSVVVANPPVAWLVVHSGRRSSFVIVGALGFVWPLAWQIRFATAEKCTWLPRDHRAMCPAVGTFTNILRPLGFSNWLGLLKLERLRMSFQTTDVLPD